MTKRIKSAAAYLRRSTTKQEESLEIQRQVIEDYAAEYGYRIPDENWFVDDGVSGSRADRPEFEAMKAAAAAGRFDNVLVRDLSRFSRESAHRTLQHLSELYEDCDVTVIDIMGRGEIDLEDLPTLVMSLFESYGNEKELVEKSSRVSGGMLARAKAGRWLGKNLPFGYDKMLVDADGQPIRRVKRGEKVVRDRDTSFVLVPTKDKAILKLIQWMFDQYAYTNRGIRDIVDELNDQPIRTSRGGQWTRPSVRNILMNPVYAGHTYWNRKSQGKFYRISEDRVVPRSKKDRKAARAGRSPRSTLNSSEDWVVVKDTHEPIVSQELFDATQERFGDKRYMKVRKNTRYTFALAGMVYCKHCGARAQGYSQTQKRKSGEYVYRRYMCGTYTQWHHKCDRNSVDADTLERVVVQTIADGILTPDNLKQLKALYKSWAKGRGSKESGVPELKVRLRKLESDIDKAAGRLLQVDDDLFDTVKAKLVEMKRERDKLAAKIQRQESKAPAELPTFDEVVALVDQIESKFRRANPDRYAGLLKAYVDRVTFQCKWVTKGGRRVRQCTGGTIRLCMSGTGGIVDRMNHVAHALELEFTLGV